MAIDVTVPQSPGWWMQRLWQQLRDDQKRFALLDNYMRGTPPLPWGSTDLQSAFYRFQRVARSNFADLIVGAACERQAVRSVRTAATQDDAGDEAATEMWLRNGLPVYETDVYRHMRAFGVAFGSVAVDEGRAVIVAEDPRQVTTAQDPIRPTRTLAAFKIYNDPVLAMDVAILWLPGQKWVATRPRRARSMPVTDLTGPPPPVHVGFTPSAYTMAPFAADAADVPAGGAAADDLYDGDLFSETYTVQRVPVERFGNRGGVGDFELHTDLLDRINHMILQRIQIATMQAFRQRAIELPEELPERDEAGNVIDYDDLFAADPGALWKLPVGAKIWESTEVDLTGILSAVKDDVMHLGAVTRTPFSMFSSDAVNQSAEGAQLTREGLVFRVEDGQRIASRAWANLIATGFAFEGDETRSDPSKILVDWLPAERYSLQERAAADSAAVSLPKAQKYRLIWGMSPDESRIAMSQAAEDAVLAQQQATLAAAARPAPPQADQSVPATAG